MRCKSSRLELLRTPYIIVSPPFPPSSPLQLSYLPTIIPLLENLSLSILPGTAILHLIPNATIENTSPSAPGFPSAYLIMVPCVKSSRGNDTPFYYILPTIQSLPNLPSFLPPLESNKTAMLYSHLAQTIDTTWNEYKRKYMSQCLPLLLLTSRRPGCCWCGRLAPW